MTSGAPVEGGSPFTKVPKTPATEPPTYTYTLTGPEGISGKDGAATPAPSVLYTPVLTTAPAEPVIGTQPDLAPVGEIVNPDRGEAVEAGVTVEPVVFTEDDYGIRSVSLKVNGAVVASKVQAPYAFTWTPTAAEIGTSVALEATITDSGGHVVTSTVTVPVVTSVAKVGAKAGEKAAAKEAEEKAAAAKAGEDGVKAAEAKAEAAAKEAKEAKELAEAGKSPVSTGRVSKNTSKGTARLSVLVPSPGSLVVTGPEIKKVSGHATAPGQVQVFIAAKGKALKTLDATGKVTVKVKITFTGRDGKKQRATTTVALIKR